MKKKLTTVQQRFSSLGGKARWKGVDDKVRSEQMRKLALKSVKVRQNKAKLRDNLTK